MHSYSHTYRCGAGHGQTLNIRRGVTEEMTITFVQCIRIQESHRKLRRWKSKWALKNFTEDKKDVRKLSVSELYEASSHWIV